MATEEVLINKLKKINSDPGTWIDYLSYFIKCKECESEMMFNVSSVYHIRIVNIFCRRV